MIGLRRGVFFVFLVFADFRARDAFFRVFMHRC
jgi:hypothetical protein